MASSAMPEDVAHGESARPDTSEAEAALRAKLSRKRTKTGCLTCRKRRIKCGEEKPVCKNCVKSKRHCEGYNQRVVFKQPNYEYHHHPNGAAPFNFPAPPIPAPYVQDNGQPAIAPAYYSHPPPPPPPYADFYPQQQNAFYNAQPQSFDQHPQHYPGPPPPPGYAGPSGVPSPGMLALPYHHARAGSQSAPQPPAGSFDFAYPSTQASTPQVADPHLQGGWQTPYHPRHDRNPHFTPSADPNIHEKISSASNTSPSSLQWSHSSSAEIPSPIWPSNGFTPHPEYTRPPDYQAPPFGPQPAPRPSSVSTGSVAHQGQRLQSPEFFEHVGRAERPSTMDDFLTQAAVEYQDDDYYDIESEEDPAMYVATPAPVDRERQRALHSILKTNDINIQDPQTRRYDTFTHGGVLAHYKAEEAANPLRNPLTARVFAHFIAVTGPSLSIYERKFLSTSVLFADGQVPLAQQSLWTYTMPMAALRHQGLLHAMLALASLHIARLSGASATPSIQHYAWALKRIHSDVGDETKRFKLSTIAASMLLGFYEVMTADHMKWNMHLAGSRQLFLETDFSTMSKQFRRMKAERASRREQGSKRKATPPQSDELLDQIPDVDENVISDLAGREVRYGSQGQILTQNNSIPPPLDLSRFEILKDLYWWYLKQDVYQSIISGNPLLLDYSRWANCPPRAPLGKPDAVYGTFDHLILLLGRIADFSSKDRARKLKAMEANGGQWKPSSGMKLPGPGHPSQPNPPTPASTTSGNTSNEGSMPGPQTQSANPPPGPQFFGMAPPPRQNVEMPASYQSASDLPTPDQSSSSNPIDLHAATQAALEEYGRIRAALHTFANSLGEPFLPLTSEHQPPLETPFGSALFYRSYDIGCLWATYHMAMIIAIRSHPHMHPAAHAAAAIAAHETHFFANEIGRIAAGIVPGPPDQQLNPTLGAALCESCMPSFFAAIQYANPDQRHQTVHRIYSIAQRTGWGSAELIANGCETAWVKAAAAGRGPAYRRVVRREQSGDPRLNGSWERLDPTAAPDERDEADRRFVATKPIARLNWAIGIMGTEDDERMKA